MDGRAIFGWLVVPAVAFALAYFPIVSRLTWGLVSSYPKADIGKRMGAAALDGMAVLGTFFLYRASDSIAFLGAGAVYVLFRDAIKGQSIGKGVLGLVVIELETGRPASLLGSLKRNALFLLPGANVVAVFLETGTVLRDIQGQRLGDRLAQTQVVEGVGALELVKSFQEWLMTLGLAVGSAGRRRSRAPVGTDRAA
jgi:hypothetical protein